MSLSTAFGFSKPADIDVDLGMIYPFTITLNEFIKKDITHLYKKILTDVIERTHGLSEDYLPTLFDNCLGSETKDGLLTILSRAMFNKADLYLVYNGATGVLREATEPERRQIEIDYKAQGESKVGVYVSFRTLDLTDLLKVFSALEYNGLYAFNTSMNISTSLQFKISMLRQSVGNADATVAAAQALKMATALKKGNDVLMDEKDSIVNSVVDVTPTEKSMAFLNQKRSYYLGLPAAYISGEQTSGMGTTGENDTKAIERGLKQYYVSIVKPILETLFSIKVSYKSQDTRQLDLGLKALQTFELTDDTYINSDDKKKIVNQLFDIDTDYGTDK